MASSAAFELILQLKDNASKGLGQAAQQGGFLKNALSFATGGAILGGITAIGKAAGDMFGDAIGEAKEWNTQLAQVDAVLASTGGKAGITKDAVLELNKSLSAGGGFSAAADDAVLSGQNMLLTFTNIGSDVMPEATKAMIDMATKMNNGVTPSGEQLSKTAIQMGKALNDPIKGLTALSKVGVSFTAEQKDTIKALANAKDGYDAYAAATGKGSIEAAALLEGVTSLPEAMKRLKDSGLAPLTAEQQRLFESVLAGNGTMEAQKLILKELGTEFGGSATAAMGTFEGQQQLMAEQFNNIKQTIGEALMPILSGLTSFLSTTLIPAIQAMLPVLGSVFGFIRDNAVPILVALAPLILSQVIPAFVGWAATMLTTVLPAFIATMAPIIAAAAPFIALGAAVAALWFAFENNFLGIRDLVMPIVDAIKEKLSIFWTVIQPKLIEAWDKIKAGINTAINFIKGVITTGIDTIKNAWETNWGGIRTIVETAWNLISGIVSTAWAIVEGIITVGLALITGDWEGAWQGIQDTFSTIWNKLTTEILPNAVGMIWTVITEFLPKLIGQLAEWGAAFIGWVVPRIPELLLNLGQMLLEIGKWIITEALPAIVKQLGEWAKAFLDWIGTSVLPFIGQKLGELWTAITNWIKETATNIWNKVQEIGSSIIEGIKKGIGDAWQNFLNWVGGKFDELGEFLFGWIDGGSPALKYVPVGSSIVQGVQKGVVDEWDQFFMPAVATEFQALYDTSMGESTDPKWQTPGYEMANNISKGWGGFFPNLRATMIGDIDLLVGEVRARAEQIQAMMEAAQQYGSATGGPGYTHTGPVPGGGGGGGIGVLDRGGIVTGPRLAALAMDRNPEAVIPLDRLERWMGGARGGGTNIYVTVNAPLLANSKQQAADEIAEMLYDRLQGRV